MVIVPLKIQESSPLIIYSPGWTQGNDSETARGKYDGSYRVTNTPGSTINFPFLGTNVSFYGAFRPNYGEYSVSIDTNESLLLKATADASLFKQSLITYPYLNYTEHVATIINVPTSPDKSSLDLDYIVLERQIGGPGPSRTIHVATLDDSSSLIGYMGHWSEVSSRDTAYNHTLHNTTSTKASASISFQGCCIELYGQYANAKYGVELDNMPQQTFTGLDKNLDDRHQHPRTLIYLRDNLTESQSHTVVLTNLETNENRPFYFDYAVISGIKPVSFLQSPDSSKSNPTASIVGGVFGTIILLSLLAFCFILRRRKRKTFATASVSYAFTSVLPSTSSPSSVASSDIDDHSFNGKLSSTMSSRDSRRINMRPKRSVSILSRISHELPRRPKPARLHVVAPSTTYTTTTSSPGLGV